MAYLRGQLVMLPSVLKKFAEVYLKHQNLCISEQKEL